MVAPGLSMPQVEEIAFPSDGRQDTQMGLNSISTRFIGLAALATLAVIAFTVMSFAGLVRLQSSDDTLQTIAQIVQRHMEGDMMHDA